MVYVAYFDFGDGAGERGPYSLRSATSQERVCSDSFRLAASSWRISLCPDSVLLASHLASPGVAIVRILSDGVLQFKGVIPPTDSWTDNGAALGAVPDISDLEFEILSRSDLLERKITAADAIAWQDVPVCDPAYPTVSIVHRLLSLAGVTNFVAAAVETTVLHAYSVEEGTTIGEALDSLLYQYGLVLRWNVDHFETFRWLIENPVATATLDENVILSGLKSERLERESDGIEVKWYSLKDKANCLLYMADLPFGQDNIRSGYPVEPGFFWPEEASPTPPATDPTEAWWQYDDSVLSETVTSSGTVKKNTDFTQIVLTKNHRIDANVDAGLVLAVAGMETKRARVAYKNPTAGALNIWYCNIYGDVIYRGAENFVCKNTIASPKKTITLVAEHIHDSVSAARLACALADLYGIACYRHSMRSLTRFELGTTALLYSPYSGTTSLILIVGRDYDAETEIYSYTGISISPVTINPTAVYVAAAFASPPTATSDPRMQALAARPGPPGSYRDYRFCRNAAMPSTPTGNDPPGWYDTPPAGTDPIWMSLAWRDGGTDTVIGAWSVPQGLSGDRGPIGPAGGAVTWLGSFPDFPDNPVDSVAFYHTVNRKSYVFNDAGSATFFSPTTLFGPSTLFMGGSWYVMAVDSPYMQAQYSADEVNWHWDPLITDIYMRLSSDGAATWSASVRIKGENGDLGLPGTDGVNGVDGLPALLAILTNDNHSLPSDAEGTVSLYAGSGTDIVVFEGPAALTYVSTAPAAGQFTVGAPVVSPTGKLTAGALSGSGSAKATVADHSAMDTTTDSITVTYPITAKRANGSTVNLNLVQTLTKAKQGIQGVGGAPAIAYWLVTDAAALAKSQAGAYTPAALAIYAKSATGTSAPAAYAGRFVITETTDGTNWTTKYTSSVDESAKSHTPSAGIKAVRIRLYLAGGTTTLLDEEVVPVVSDGTVISWLGSFSEFPGAPTEGQAFYHTIHRKSYVWNQVGIVPTYFGAGTLFGPTTLFRGGSWHLMASDSPYLQAQYSQDGASWHGNALATDIYARFSTDGGVTWSTVTIKGSKGDQGDKGDQGPHGVIDDLTIPKYLGAFDSDPASPYLGQWYFYKGPTTQSRTQNTMYKWTGAVWSIDTDSGHLSAAITDLLALAAAAPQTIQFINNLAVNNEFVNRLFALYIAATGSIAFAGEGTKTVIDKNGISVYSGDLNAPVDGDTKTTISKQGIEVWKYLGSIPAWGTGSWIHADGDIELPYISGRLKVQNNSNWIGMNVPMGTLYNQCSLMNLCYFGGEAKRGMLKTLSGGWTMEVIKVQKSINGYLFIGYDRADCQYREIDVINSTSVMLNYFLVDD